MKFLENSKQYLERSIYTVWRIIFLYRVFFVFLHLHTDLPCLEFVQTTVKLDTFPNQKKLISKIVLNWLSLILILTAESEGENKTVLLYCLSLSKEFGNIDGFKIFNKKVCKQLSHI